MSNTEKQFAVIAESSLFRLNGPAIDILDELQTLCECVTAEDETEWNIGEFGEFTLDELIVGAYEALTECHAGQSSQSYAVLCLLGAIYSPGASGIVATCGPEDDTGEKHVFDMICADLLSKVSA